MQRGGISEISELTMVFGSPEMLVIFSTTAAEHLNGGFCNVDPGTFVYPGLAGWSPGHSQAICPGLGWLRWAPLTLRYSSLYETGNCEDRELPWEF